MKELNDFLSEPLRKRYTIVDQNLDPILSTAPEVVLNVFGHVNVSQLTEEKIQNLLKIGCPFIKPIKEVAKLKKVDVTPQE